MEGAGTETGTTAASATPRRTQKVTFANARGVDLAAALDSPAGPVRATALFAHCFTCTKDLRSAKTLSSALVDRGFAVLRFDFTGLGQSGGEFEDSDFTSQLDDLEAAADYLRDNHRAPSLMIGHSLGGTAVLMAAPNIPEVKAVATLGAPSEPAHLKEGILRSVDPESGVSEIDIGGRPFRVSGSLLRDLESHKLLDGLGHLGKALLILHSPVDEVVSIDHARRLYEAARHPKSFVSLDGADHLLLKDPRDAEFVAEILSAWAGRYVGTPVDGADENEGQDVEPLPPGVVEVRGTQALYTSQVRAGHHHLTTDEPERLGGADKGPSPHEMLLAGLGSCIAMTLRMYADRKAMPLLGVRVRLRHSKIEASECDDCQTEEGLIDDIEKEIELHGPELTDEQRQRLLEISDRCPVHRTLTSETRIRRVDDMG